MYLVKVSVNPQKFWNHSQHYLQPNLPHLTFLTSLLSVHGTDIFLSAFHTVHLPSNTNLSPIQKSPYFSTLSALSVVCTLFVTKLKIVCSRHNVCCFLVIILFSMINTNTTSHIDFIIIIFFSALKARGLRKFKTPLKVNKF